MRLKLKMALAVGLLMGSILGADPAGAVPVFINGTPDNTNGWAIDSGFDSTFKVANSFTLAAETTLTSINFRAFSSNTIPTLTYFILANIADPFISGGPPAGVSVLGSGISVAVTNNGIVDSNFGLNINSYSFFLTPLTLSAGTYILALQDANDSNNGRTFWEKASGGSSLGYAAFSGGANHRLANGGSNYFVVNGDPVGVPEMDPKGATVPFVLMFSMLGLVSGRGRKVYT